jgi:hypothetical protein
MTIPKKDDVYNTKQTYEDLISRCKSAKEYYIRCLVDESWTGIQGRSPFDITIEDGIFTITVVSTNCRDAMLKVLEFVPVVKFLDECED